MAATLLSWVDEKEPVTFDDVRAQCFIDADDENAKYLIETNIIPAARQLAETRTGSAIRRGKYRETLKLFPTGDFTLSKGRATKILKVTCGGLDVSVGDFLLLDIGGDMIVSPISGSAGAGPAYIEFEAGIDIAAFPSVKQWILLACGWAFEQRELLLAGQPIQEMPASYVDSLLQPITTPPRF
ncbi:hypothetical protein [Collimonas humicola]|uniref:hypothetical protein n=1 Tax=Collimonas humicola TaxID=2825886 RepID=UPI001B8CE539|nr:hypothetical protein [Collimonas humicola]